MTNPPLAERLRGDFFGGVTAAIVALPLALAFGAASGLGPIAGLYGAIAVGLFAAIFGGTPAQVSGPTGPMTVVMAAIVAQYADRIETAFAIVVLGGAIQLIFGLLRVGRYVAYTPYSVISGFMSGIGVIIILMQLPPFLGAPAAGGGPIGAIEALPAAFAGANADAAIIAAACLSVMVLWPARLRAILPPPLAALATGIALSLTVFDGAPVIGPTPTGLPQIHLPVIPLAELGGAIQPAFILALLGTIDSLLTSLIADSITRTKHDSNRELIGQGLGNMAAGLVGGLPGAGATMRTVVNIRAGGRTPLSGAVHSLILISILFGLGPLAAQIPYAALSGMLIKVGWDIIDWGYLKRIARAPRDKVVVMFITLGLTVFVDLVTAVAVGLILAGFVTASWMAEDEMEGVKSSNDGDEFTLSAEEESALAGREDIFIMTFSGRFSYASAREISKRAGAVTGGFRAVILDFAEIRRLDTSAAMALEELICAIRARHIICLIAGLSGQAEKTLRALGVLDHLNKEDIAPDRLEAIRRAVSRLSARDKM
ncbi:MAG: SulP family inorganic anion transporter [Parvularculaceae bacterium]